METIIQALPALTLALWLLGLLGLSLLLVQLQLQRRSLTSRAARSTPSQHLPHLDALTLAALGHLAQPARGTITHLPRSGFSFLPAALMDLVLDGAITLLRSGSTLRPLTTVVALRPPSPEIHPLARALWEEMGSPTAPNTLDLDTIKQLPARLQRRLSDELSLRHGLLLPRPPEPFLAPHRNVLVLAAAAGAIFSLFLLLAGTLPGPLALPLFGSLFGLAALNALTAPQAPPLTANGHRQLERLRSGSDLPGTPWRPLLLRALTLGSGSQAHHLRGASLDLLTRSSPTRTETVALSLLVAGLAGQFQNGLIPPAWRDPLNPVLPSSFELSSLEFSEISTALEHFTDSASSLEAGSDGSGSDGDGGGCGGCGGD